MWDLGCDGPVDPAAQPISGKGAASMPIELSMHCGFRLVVVASDTWVPVGTPPSPSMRRDQAGGLPLEKGSVNGTWTVVAPDRARFDVTDPAVEPIPGGVVFMRLPAGADEPPPCA